MFFKKKVMKENALDINSMVDLTLVDPRATYDDIEKLCKIAYQNGYGCICVNSCNASYAKGFIAKHFKSKLKVAVTVGFPLGAQSIEAKLFETKCAIEDGADEIEMVANFGRVKALDFNYVKKEIEKIRKLSKKQILKVIIETCYLDENEIIKISKICASAKVDYIETSTGFGTAGANENVLKIIKNAVGSKCKVKVSGAIKTREQAITFANLGANRIGTSSLI